MNRLFCQPSKSSWSGSPGGTMYAVPLNTSCRWKPRIASYVKRSLKVLSAWHVFHLSTQKCSKRSSCNFTIPSGWLSTHCYFQAYLSVLILLQKCVQLWEVCRETSRQVSWTSWSQWSGAVVCSQIFSFTFSQASQYINLGLSLNKIMNDMLHDKLHCMPKDILHFLFHVILQDINSMTTLSLWNMLGIVE